MAVAKVSIELPQPLVSASWLKRNADAVRIVDCRWYQDGRSGYEAYLEGHIPGAVWADLDRELSGPATKREGRHPLPSPKDFAGAMQRLGIDNTTPVVAYDDLGGPVAARLWWMLRVHRHPVAVLDGGLDSWSGQLTVRETKLKRRGTFTPRPWPSDRFVGPDDFEEGDLLIDARSAARYAKGDRELDPRPGHIPGARNLPWTGNLDDGYFKSQSALIERYRPHGVERADRVIAYCGSGVTACHDLLALEIAGNANYTALYTGSWSQWGADRSRPAREGKHP